MVVPPPRRKKEGGAKNGVSMYMKLAEAVSEILQTDGKTEIIQRYTPTKHCFKSASCRYKPHIHSGESR